MYVYITKGHAEDRRIYGRGRERDVGEMCTKHADSIWGTELMGKGSTYRPVNRKKWNAAWERIEKHKEKQNESRRSTKTSR